MYTYRYTVCKGIKVYRCVVSQKDKIEAGLLYFIMITNDLYVTSFIQSTCTLDKYCIQMLVEMIVNNIFFLDNE